jgi:hypothetical protein
VALKTIKQTNKFYTWPKKKLVFTLTLIFNWHFLGQAMLRMLVFKHGLFVCVFCFFVFFCLIRVLQLSLSLKRK